MRIRLLSMVVIAWAGCTASNNNNMGGEDLSETGDDFGGLHIDMMRLAVDLSGTVSTDMAVITTNDDLAGSMGSTDMAGASPSPTPSPSPSPSPSPGPCGGALGLHPLTNFVGTPQVFAVDNAAFGLVVPSGFRVQGTVQMPTVGTPVFIQGTISFADANFTYSANTTSTGTTSFSYTMVIPPGTYTVTSSVEVSLNAGNYPTIKVTHTEAATVELCQDKTVDLTLPSVGSVQSATVHVGGLENLGTPAGNKLTVFPRFEYKPDANTIILSTGGANITSFPIGAGVKADVSVTVPVQQLDGALEVFAPGKADVARTGAYDFQITQGTGLAAGNSYDFNVPTVASTNLLTMTGTAGGTTANLRPASTVATFDELSRVNCSAVGSSALTEFSIGGFYADALNFSSFLRKGMACAVFTDLRVIVSPAADVARENKFARLFTPDPTTITNPPTVNGNLTPTISVPNYGSSIAITGSLKDSANNPLDGYSITASSTVLTDVINLSGDGLDATVTTDGTGTFILHLLPGTYNLFLAK